MGNVASGGQKAESSFDQITDIATSVITTDVMNCPIVVKNNQEIKISGNYNIVSDVEMVQAVKIDVDCFQKTTNETDLQSRIVEKIMQQMKLDGSAEFGGLSSQKVTLRTKITNLVRANVRMDSVLNCITNVNNTQSINITGNYNIAKNIAMSQTTNMVRTCVKNALMSTKMKSDIESDAQLQSALKTETVAQTVTGFFGDIIAGGLMTYIAIAIIIGAIALAIIIGAAVVLSRKGNLEKTFAAVNKFTNDKREVVQKNNETLENATKNITPETTKGGIAVQMYVH